MLQLSNVKVMDSVQYQVLVVRLNLVFWPPYDVVHFCISGVSSYVHSVAEERLLPGSSREWEGHQNPKRLHHGWQLQRAARKLVLHWPHPNMALHVENVHVEDQKERPHPKWCPPLKVVPKSTKKYVANLRSPKPLLFYHVHNNELQRSMPKFPAKCLVAITNPMVPFHMELESLVLLLFPKHSKVPKDPMVPW